MMSYFSQTLSPLRTKIKKFSPLFLWGSVAIVGIASSVLGSHGAIAAETVILRYTRASENVEIPFSELETFAKHGQPSPTLKAFLAQTSLSPEEMSKFLAGSIPDTGIPLGKTDIQFLLFQLNKLVGDPLNRENLRPLALSLRSAYLDQNMSFLELLRRYPEPTVGLNVRKLNTVFQDVDLFVQRISPLFNFLEDLLPDLVCDCQLTSDSSDASVSQLKQAQKQSHSGLREDRLNLKQTPTSTVFNASLWASNSTLITSQDPGPLLPSQDTIANIPSNNVNPKPDQSFKAPTISRKVVFEFGPVKRSFEMKDLNQFAATGKVPREWRSYLKIAKVDPKAFRELLTAQKKVNSLELDQLLNSLPGEYALFQLGQLVYTPSRRGNVQAMRSSVILSAIDDEHISLLEVLQNYPSQWMTVDAKKMLKFTKNLKGKGTIKLATANLEEVMVAAQIAIAKEICDCVTPTTEDTNTQNMDDDLSGAANMDLLLTDLQCQGKIIRSGKF